VELLVSLTLLVVISLILASILQSTNNVWLHTSGKMQQFRAASIAFDSLTRRLGQATLNTSWGYHYPGNDTTKPPDSYVRQSDLRFLSGNAQTLIGAAAPHRPTHAVFFQAPLGTVDDPTNFGGLNNLLNTCGYYIEFNKDSHPAFLDALPHPPAARFRYRLMEMLQPANGLTVYNFTSGNPTYAGHDWFTVPLSLSSPPVHVLAENVIALVLLPKLSTDNDSTGTTLAPAYTYDSTTSNSTASLNPFNQLPPIVQVTLVAVDEASAIRMSNGSTAPAFDTTLSSLFTDATHYNADITTLQNLLIGEHVNFRVFTSNVSIRAAKWSLY
jgi:uncharacterized protein (TIGR02599 family)